MKTFFLSIGICFFFLLHSFPASAQTETPVIDAELKVITTLPKVASPAAQQPIPLPEPFTLQGPNGNCFTIWCAEGEGCEHCTLYWKDRNGDGQVNPKKELRCRCDGDPEKECKLKWQQVACED